MNLGGIADSLNIAQGKDLIKYAYSVLLRCQKERKKSGLTWQ